VYKLALALGKTPCVCGDGPGFIVNRILGIYMNEAGKLAMEGNSIAVIDQALLEFGMPMGPFRLMDEGWRISHWNFLPIVNALYSRA
jgi:3-hydroxyacyl-CoA dehydrogenase / enoyl-CoA hydratase / 3-hydroxybutyryl-CoA epimerase